MMKIISEIVDCIENTLTIRYNGSWDAKVVNNLIAKKYKNFLLGNSILITHDNYLPGRTIIHF